jgi:SpoIID/LytB domain protein
VALSLEEYLYGLAEMPVSWPMNALEAQVVAARSFAAWKARAGLRGDCSCHLVWDTFDQAYRGWHPLNEGNPSDGHRWRTAVDQTAGEVAVHPSGSTTLAETYYFSSDGGATENVWEVWGPDTPQYRAKYSYLATKPDTWSPRFTNETSTIRWTRNTTAGHIVNVLSRGKSPMFRDLDELVAISIEGLRASGSPNRIAVTGLAAGFPTIEALTGTELVAPLGLTSHFIHSFDGLDPGSLAASDRNTVAISSSQATHAGGASTVYLTIGKSHPHALALAPAAAQADAPILMLQANGRATPETKSELQRLDPDRVLVVAPPTDVSASALLELENLLPQAEVVRVAGSNRFKSAAALTQEAFPGGVHTVYIGSKGPFPTALLASHTATSQGAAMLPVKPGKIPAAIREELSRLAPARIVVIGNSEEISDAVLASLGGYSFDVSRISSANEFGLTVQVAMTAYPTGADTVYLSVGRSHAFALAGSTIVAGDPGPLLYVRKGSIPPVVLAELERLRPERIVVLSQSANIASDTLAQLAGFALP